MTGKEVNDSERGGNPAHVCFTQSCEPLKSISYMVTFLFVATDVHSSCY